MIQKDVRFFDRNEWENEADCVSMNRTYSVAIWTMIVSLTVASYGFWRDTLSDTRRKTYDIVFSGGASASGSLAFACFILFFFFHNFREDFEEGEVASFCFGLCCFFLAALYFTLDVITVRNGGKSNTPTVKRGALI